MIVLVTGATGFIGSQIAAALVARGDQVRVLRRESSRTAALDGLPVEHVCGDILDRAAVDRAVAGCDAVFHAAGLSSYWRAHREDVYRVNVDGTRTVMAACLAAGVPRVVHTSSVGAIGVPRNGRIADECFAFDPREMRFAYGHSKHLAEEEVRAAVSQGLSAVIVNPGVVIGPGDHNLISGSLIVELARHPAPAAPPGGVCMADIDAVVQGHLVAAERGRAGERYILGGQNLTYREIFSTIREIAGRPPPRWTLPAWILPPAAATLDLINRFVRRPLASGDQVRLAARRAFFDSTKAVRELDYPLLPFRGAAERAYRWYAQHGYIH